MRGDQDAHDHLQSPRLTAARLRHQLTLFGQVPPATPWDLPCHRGDAASPLATKRLPARPAVTLAMTPATGDQWNEGDVSPSGRRRVALQVLAAAAAGLAATFRLLHPTEREAKRADPETVSCKATAATPPPPTQEPTRRSAGQAHLADEGERAQVPAPRRPRNDQDHGASGHGQAGRAARHDAENGIADRTGADRASDENTNPTETSATQRCLDLAGGLREAG